jgi:hypothetical protein
MSYVKAYVEAFFEIAKVLGLVLLVQHLSQGDALALFFLFLSLTAGVAGPVGLLISGGKDDK